MILKRIQIERFRSLRRFEGELGPGITVVRGPNESGKSTIMEAILAALFEAAGADSARVRACDSWNDPRRPRLRIEFDTASGPAVLDKDFDAKKTRLEHPGGTVTAARPAGAWLCDQLGCSTQDLYLATAGVREEDVAVFGVGKNTACSREIVARLQAMLTGGPGGSPGQVMQLLKKRLDEIRKKPAARALLGRSLEENRRRLDELDRRRKKLRQDLSALDLHQAESEKIQDRILSLERELSSNKTVMGNHRLLLAAERRARELADRLQLLDRARERHEELSRVRRELERFPGYDLLGPEVERLQAREAERELTENSLTDLSRRKFERPARRPPGEVFLGLAALGALAAAVAAVLLRSGWPLLGLAAAAGLLAQGWRVNRRAAAAESSRRREMDAGIGDAEDRLLRLEHEINEIVRKFGRVSTADCLAAYREYQGLAGEARALERTVNDLAGPGGPGPLEGRSRETSLELRLERDRLAELIPYRIEDPVRYRRLEEEIARQEDEHRRLAAKRVELGVRIGEAEYDPEELAAVEEERAELTRALEYWERQSRVHDKAREVLGEATAAVLARAGEVIQKEMAPFVSRITGGRYREVRADNELNLALYSESRGGWCGPDELSLSTREQLHLGARLALVRLITGDKKPPLLLDDPFAHFDEQRLEAAMAVLKIFARDHQIIIFAPTARYDAAADRVIELGTEADLYYPPGPRPTTGKDSPTASNPSKSGSNTEE